MPAKAPQCWACGHLIGKKPAVSMDGSNDKHVCFDCWMRVPTSKRILIRLIALPEEDGGLGLRAILRRFLPPLFGRN